MSRSRWALTEASAFVRIVVGNNGERPWLGDRTDPEAEPPLVIAHSKLRLPSLMAASLIALSCWPAVAVARSAVHAGGDPSNTHVKVPPPRVLAGTPRPRRSLATPQTHPRRRATAGPDPVFVVLAPGSGTDRSGGSDAVRQLQRGLSDAGYAPGQLDGRYGSLTKAAVVRYQEDRGLVADGVAGPQTRRALSTATPLLYPGAGAEPGGSRLVRTLQRLLAQAGDAVGPVDGRYGPLTEQAVRHFQAVHGLPADGIAGPQTYARLRKPGRSEQRPRPKPGSPGVTHRIPARPGAAQGNPAPAGTRNRGRGVSRPTGVSSTGTRLLIAALVLAVLGIGTQWYMRRRRRGRLVGGIEARSQNHDPSGPAPELTTDLSTSTGDEAAEACNLGVALERQGDIPGAEAAYRRADERGDANGAFNLGGLLADRGDIPGAEAAYRRADERGDPGGAANLGALLERRGDLAGAEAAYHRADMRGDAGGAATLGALLERRGDMAGAEAAYRRAADRGHAGATSTLGGLLSKQNAAGGAETNTPHERRGVFGRPGGGPE